MVMGGLAFEATAISPTACRRDGSKDEAEIPRGWSVPPLTFGGGQIAGDVDMSDV